MKKQNNLKSKTTARFLIKCILIQVAILLFFSYAFYHSMPINANDCISKEIVIEDKEYVRAFYEDKCYVFCDDIKYEYANLGMFGKYSHFEFYESINIGQTLDIVYTERFGLLGKYNYIVGAKDDTNVYLDFESYNSSKQIGFGFMIAIFFLFEVIYVAVLLLTIFVNKNFKFSPHRKKKKTN